MYTFCFPPCESISFLGFGFGAFVVGSHMAWVMVPSPFPLFLSTVDPVLFRGSFRLFLRARSWCLDVAIPQLNQIFFLRQPTLEART